MALTPAQQTALNAMPFDHRAAIQAAYEAQNVKGTPGGGSGGGVSPSSLVSTTTRNPSGTMEETSSPNLGPQQHQFALEQLQAEGAQQTALEKQKAEAAAGAATQQQGATSNLAKQEAEAAAHAATQQQTATASLQQQQTAAEQALLSQRASLSNDTFSKRLAALGPQLAPAPEVTYGGQGGGMAPDEQGARDSAFARAKDMAGQNALAALKSVKGVTEDRGLMGSTYEAGLLGNVIGGAQGAVNDYGRERLMQDLGRSTQIADARFQGGITQRGQNLALKQALLGLVGNGPLY